MWERLVFSSDSFAGFGGPLVSHRQTILFRPNNNNNHAKFARRLEISDPIVLVCPVEDQTFPALGPNYIRRNSDQISLPDCQANVAR